MTGGQTPVLKDQLILASLTDLKNQLEEEIAYYENLKENRAAFLKERELAELPSLITEYKIISGMTQKEFSKKIGMKEQQLQRYEAEAFKSISFKNLLKILQAIGLAIIIKDTPVEKRNKSHSDGNHSIA